MLDSLGQNSEDKDWFWKQDVKLV